VIHQTKWHRWSEPPGNHELCQLPLSGSQRLLLVVAIHVASLLVAAAERLPPASRSVCANYRSGGE
jgi:hypothetical protein